MDDKKLEEKSFKVPYRYQIKEVINYMYDTMELKNHCNNDLERNDALSHIELIMKTKPASLGNEPPEEGPDNYILLDNEIATGLVRNELWSQINRDLY